MLSCWSDKTGGVVIFNHNYFASPVSFSLLVSPSSHMELRKRVKENVTQVGYDSCHFCIVDSFDQCQLDHS